MGFTVWLLEQKVARTELSLSRLRERMDTVRQEESAGRITKARMRDGLVELEAKAGDEHLRLSDLLGRLRKARESRRVLTSSS